MTYEIGKTYWISSQSAYQGVLDTTYKATLELIRTEAVARGESTVLGYRRHYDEALDHIDTRQADGRVSEKLLPLLMRQLKQHAPEEYEELNAFRSFQEDEGWREVMRQELAESVAREEKLHDQLAKVFRLRQTAIEERDEAIAARDNAVEQYQTVKECADRFYAEKEVFRFEWNEARTDAAKLTNQLKEAQAAVEHHKAEYQNLLAYHRQSSKEKSELLGDKNGHILKLEEEIRKLKEGNDEKHEIQRERMALKEQVRRLQNEVERLRYVGGHSEATLATVFDEVRSAIDILRTAIGGK